MPVENSSRAPWLDDRANWGRVRFTKRMWRSTYLALGSYLDALWSLHKSQPNPSPESRTSLDEIREIQKVMDNMRGLAEEKGWDIPAPSGGNSTTG